jgi:NAD-dependent SIR2 family protein deacetylase
MDLKFKELKCPACNAEMEQGSITVHDDVKMVKRCSECDFWMIIVIPNDVYNYSVKKKLKSALENEA